MAGRSEYVLRDGNRYDATMICMAETWFKEGITEFQETEAERLWAAVADDNAATTRDTLLATARYILNKYAFEAGAHTYLTILVDPPASSDLDIQLLDGVFVVTRILDQARRLQNEDEELGRPEAEVLWQMALTQDEYASISEEYECTLWYCLDRMKFTPEARELLERNLGERPPPSPGLGMGGTCTCEAGGICGRPCTCGVGGSDAQVLSCFRGFWQTLGCQ